MKRRIVIHIGPEKTGSSALQRHLLAHRDELVRRHRLLYPAAGRLPEHPSEAHMRVFRALRSGTPEAVVRDVMREADEAEAEVVVLSHERFGHLYRYRPEAIRRLRELLSGCDIDLVLYPRRQDDWVMSDYNQQLKPAVFLARIGLDRDIEDARLEEGYWRADYAAMLHGWEGAFPGARVWVRPFERSQLRSGDVVADFGAVVGTDLGALPSAGSERFNTSLHDLAVSFAVHANALMRRWYPQRLWEAWGDVLRAYNEHLRYDFADALATGDERRFGPLLSPKRRRAVLSHFVEGNETVARRHLPERAGKLFDAEPPADDADWVPPAPLEERHVDRVGRVVGLGEHVPGNGIHAKIGSALEAFVAARSGRPSTLARLRVRLSEGIGGLRR